MIADDRFEFDSECLRDVSEAFTVAHELALRVVELNAEEADMKTIFEEINDDVTDLCDDLRAYDDIVTYTFSGNGFIPVYDYNLEVARTAFAHVDNGEGKFSRISLLNPLNFSFVSAYDVAEDEDEAVKGNIDLLDENDDQEGGAMRVPRMLPGLYVEFLVNQNIGEEVCVGGIATRSNGALSYNIMDLLEVNIDRVDVRYPGATVDIYEIAESLITESKAIKYLKRDTAFRRMNRKNQIKLLETKLEDINEQAGLDRVTMVVDPKYFYVPLTGLENLFMQKVTLPEGYTHVNVDPIRVDSMELFSLTNGEGIRNNRTMKDPNAGLCLVAEINPYLRQSLGFNSDIVWIPLGDMNQESLVVIPNDYGLYEA